VQFDPQQLSEQAIYKLLAGSVVPRPIAWVTTIAPDGTVNAAPYSFFNVMASEPPLLGFAVSEKSGRKKDTMANVQATGEFVVNIVPTDLAEPMNQTAAEYGPGVNELEQVGLATVPGVRVKAPRIAASPVHLECELRQIIDLGANYKWVVGQVVLFHVADHLLMERGRIDIAQLAPLGRLVGNGYVRGGERFELTRKPPTP
jgi:flavin reductase (DIM6/NTAB) family NADH-FMN oxidoreductase RutF